MGNSSAKKKIVVLDRKKQQDKYLPLQTDIQYKVIIYDKFEQFIENEQLDTLKNIVVRFEQQKKQLLTRSQLQKQVNRFERICPYLKKATKSLKDELIEYVAKYLIQINIYLFVDDLNNIRLLEMDKPYIKLVSSDLDYIKNSIQDNSQLNSGLDIKTNRMFNGLYRRILLKVIDKGYSENKNVQWPQTTKKDFKQLKNNNNQISFLYFNDIQSFQKSNISTACQYVLCFEQQLGELIDSKKLCEEDYNIIVRADKSQLEPKLSERKKKQIWAIDIDLDIIIQKIKKCSQISDEEASKLANNSIIIGNDKYYLQNFQKYQQHIQNQFDKDKQKLKNMKITFLRSTQLNQELLPLLQIDIYSFMVVISSDQNDQFLQQVKRFLQTNKFHHRVQLTSKSMKDKINQKKYSKQDYFEQTINYLKNDVKYKLKFEVVPLFNIQLYNPKIDQINFFNRKVGIKVDKIYDIDTYLQRNTKSRIIYKQLIESQHLVCKIDDYLKKIKNKLNQNRQKNQYFKKIKIILMDSKKNVKKFTAKDENFDESIVFVDYNLSRIQEFIKVCKTSVVSIPHFRKNTLSNFQNQNKLFSVTRKTCQLMLRSTIISSNEVLAMHLGKNVKYSAFYNLQFFAFTNFNGVSDSISFFEEQYIQTYIKLWYLGYKVLMAEGDNFHFYLGSLKQDICLCFYKCKSYDLLKVSQEDFQAFYIKKIEECTTFFDLQIACIYITTLPHGFNDIISQIFKSPRKSKLAIKVFAGFVITLMTAFYQFGTQQVGTVILVSLLAEDKLKQKIQFLKPKDIVYTNDFIFCQDIEFAGQKPNQDSITFIFQNVQFLDKSRVKNFLNIEKYSFYKEGAQYLIAPFTKFEVIQKKLNQKGKYEIILNNIKSVQKSFIERVLQQNQIKEVSLWKAKEKQIEQIQKQAKKNTVSKRSQDSQLSLYKKIQKANLKQSKQNAINLFKQGSNYDNFFRDISKQRYLSASMHLEAKVKQIEKTQSVSGMQNQLLKRDLKLLGTQYGYIYFRMSQYVDSINSLKDTCAYLEQTLAIDKEADPNKQIFWKLSTVKKFIKAVQLTYINRKKLILGYPKRKLWHVTFQQGIANQLKFKLKTSKQKWQVDFDSVLETFPMTYKNAFEDQSLIQKVISAQTILPLRPQNQFGETQSISWMNSGLFQYPQIGNHKLIIDSKSLIEQNSKNKQKKQQKQIKQKDELKIMKPLKVDKKNNNYTDRLQDGYKEQPYRIPKDLQTMNWQVFYLGNEVKIVSKEKQHFHMKTTKLSQNFKQKQYSEQIQNID